MRLLSILFALSSFLFAQDINRDGVVNSADRDSVQKYLGDSLTYTPTCIDYDGNRYNVVKIGNLWWMAENLKTTHYSDGTEIQNVTDGGSWSGLTTGAYVFYNNDESTYSNAYGALYNWYAVDSLLAPNGWRVPSDADWDSLESALGMSETQSDSVNDFRGDPVGTYLKGIRDVTGGYGHPRWYGDGGGTDSVGFAGYPGGYRRGTDGSYRQIGEYAYFWTATENGASDAYNRILNYNNGGIGRYDYLDKSYGYAVRCVMDVSNINTMSDVTGDTLVDGRDFFALAKLWLDSLVATNPNPDSLRIQFFENYAGRDSDSVYIHIDSTSFAERGSGDSVILTDTLKNVDTTLAWPADTAYVSAFHYLNLYTFTGWIKGIHDSTLVSHEAALPEYSIDTVYVDTDASGAGDGTSWTDAYTSLSTAESSEQTDLTTALKKIVFSCRASSGSADDGAHITFDGWTTNDSCSIEIGCYGENAHNGYWDNTKYRISRNEGGGYILQLHDQNIHLKNIQIESTGTYDVFATIRMQDGNQTVEGCILRKTERDRGSNGIEMSNEDGYPHYIYNNIVYGYSGGISLDAQSVDSYVYNNTVFDCDLGYEMNTAQGTFVSINNLAQNCTDGFSGTFNASSDYNISDDGDAPGSNSLDSVFVTFVDTTNDNFLLSSYDTVAQQAGVELYDDADLAVTTSIEGNSRGTASAPNFDIGASHPLRLTRIVDTDGVSGHYSTLQEWETALDGLYSPVDIAKIIKAECRATTGLKDSTPVDISTWGDLSEDYYIEVCSEGDYKHSGTYDSSLYRLELDVNEYPILVGETHVHIHGLQISIDNDKSAIRLFGASTTSENRGEFYVYDCFLHRNYSGNYDSGISLDDTYFNSYVYNNIINGWYATSNESGIKLGGLSTSADTLFAYNNTIDSCYSGIRADRGVVVAINNITQNCEDGFDENGGTFHASSDYNISDIAADAPGSNSINGATVNFVNRSNDNFLLSASDTVAIDAGTDLSSDSYLPFSTDIQGDTRESSNWDIGADEYYTPTYFGNNTSGDGTIAISSGGYTFFNYDLNVQYTCPGSGEKEIREMAGLVYVTSGSEYVRLAIYNEDRDSLIAEGSDSLLVNSTDTTWVTHYTFIDGNGDPINPVLQGGTDYTIAITGSGTNLVFRRTAVTAGHCGYINNGDYTNGFPSELTSDSGTGNQICVRVGVK